MSGERNYMIEIQSAIVERNDGSWAIEITVINIPTFGEARAISQWLRGSIATSAQPGTIIPMEPQQ